MEERQICSRCVMDTSDPGIAIGSDGVCNACKAYDKQKAAYGYRPGESEKKLDALIAQIKQDGKGSAFDCVIGISGGVDSAYLAQYAVKRGLRVLAVHVDAGWNSEIAVRNIESICQKLHIDLHTYVMDWPTMKELQRAYMFSGVANLDVPQDHLFLSAMTRTARQYRVKYLLSGENLATEGAFSPFSVQHNAADAWHMKSIYRKWGRGQSLQKYPFMSLWESRMGMKNVQRVNLLDYLPYSKSKAIEELERDFDWEYYGGKHFESRFTKYFQSVYLPQKFGYDKRRSHLSCLINNGEMTREDALKELAEPPYDPAQMNEDEAYILKKLDIAPEEWQKVLSAPPTPDNAYFSQKRVTDMVKRFLSREKQDEMIFGAKRPQ